jgi:beta-N-acetylhexosaminidase
MEIDKQLGQMLMIGVAGPNLTREEEDFISRVKPAGLIYFKRNIESPEQLRQLSKRVQKLLDGNALIAIDQEGGRVTRLTEPFTTFPGNAHLGRYYLQTGKLDLVRAQASAMARELKSIGVNYNFTPVADIDSNSKNPIIGSRSFGSDPKVVAKLVAETIKVYRKEKVVSCAKHFPGHGDTFSDSHKVLPTVRASRSLLTRREMVPFVVAIRAGVPTIMTAHVIYTALDPKNPATLSRKILTGLLRTKLRFKGVIVSDDLEMNAIAKHGEIDSAAVESIEAGADLLLVCKSLERAEAVHRRMEDALRRGDLKSFRLRQSLQRIAKMKKFYVGAIPGTKVQPTLTGWSAHREVANRIRQFADAKDVCVDRNVVL